MRTLRTTISLFALTVSTLGGIAHAQTDGPPVTPGKIGFTISGVQGGAGILCSGFQCAALPLGLTRGETLTLSIRSQLQSPWLLLIGPVATPTCRTFPGILNLWAGPGIIVAAGRISGRDRIRCWGGLQTLSVPVPRTLPLNTTVAFQAIAEVQATRNSTAKAPAFSAPVRVTVTK